MGFKFRGRATTALAAAVGLIQAPAGAVAETHSVQIREIALSAPFQTRSSWRFVVTEGPPVKDVDGNDAPGALTLCLYRGASDRCFSNPLTLPLGDPATAADVGWEPHALLAARLVYPRGRGKSPLFLVVTGSVLSGDGDQLVTTQLLAYDPKADLFRRVYGGHTGHNNNQETRFVSAGPLRGSVITAEPQPSRPFGYWITVNQAGLSGAYRPVLRYGSVTRYNDGNALAVIDSEMPEIQRRLGLWTPGRPIPTPDANGSPRRCARPSLRRGELWCL